MIRQGLNRGIFCILESAGLLSEANVAFKILLPHTPRTKKLRSKVFIEKLLVSHI